MPQGRGLWRAEGRWQESLERHPRWWIGVGAVAPLALTAVAIRVALSIALTAISVSAAPSRLEDVAAPANGEASPAESRLLAIEFLSGRPTPSPEGRRQIEGIAKILAAKPQLTLHLQPSAGTADAKWTAVHNHNVPASPATMRKLAKERAGRAMVRLTTFHRARREQIAIEPATLEDSASDAPASAVAGGMTVVPGIAYWFTR